MDKSKITNMQLIGWRRQKNNAIEEFKQTQDKLLTAIVNYENKIKVLEQFIKEEIPIEKLTEQFPEAKDVVTNKTTAERHLKKVLNEKKRVEAGFKKSIAQAKVKLEEALAHLNIAEGSDRIG